jgi:hypothetical protein
MAFVVRRELMAHQARTGGDGPDPSSAGPATEVFYASMIRARANKAWTEAGLEPITPHEARHDLLLHRRWSRLEGEHCGPRPQQRRNSVNTRVLEYRYRDSNPIAERCYQWESSV